MVESVAVQQQQHRRINREDVREEVINPGKRIFNTSLFIVGMSFLANSILLYVDTLVDFLHADIFFGFSKQGRNSHLQRSSAMLGFIVGFLNLYTASIKKNKPMTVYCLFADLLAISHYLIETFLFRGIRYEYTLLVSVFLSFNVLWAVRNYYYEARLVHEKKKNYTGAPNENVNVTRTDVKDESHLD
ncbi:hypothetical protein ABK040_015674 [Willaertia magna]